MGHDDERGLVIVLVAVFMLFVVGAMAALSIDVVTLYTARSEAQLAADAAALAAARVLANSGATSDPTGTLLASVEAAAGPAKAVALQVAEQNQVGGAYLSSANVTAVTFGGTYTNPTVTVKIQKTDLPAFFARIWGRTTNTVGATAAAEAYNPSGANALGVTNRVAPTCVKPWLLPNMDPSNSGSYIFNTTTGAVNSTSNLLGWSYNSPTGTTMSLVCGALGNCSGPPAPATWSYYPVLDDPVYYPHPTSALPTCAPAITTDYQKSIAGCVETPVACNSAFINIDTSNYGPTRNSETADAINCLTHATNNDGDTLATTEPPTAPFEFIAGADNPVAGTAGKDVMVSSSLTTVPVFDSTSTANPVQIVGLVQLFLNPDGNATPAAGSVKTTVVNLVGCGTGATGQPILGNGASPVAVRLISPP